MPAGAGPDSGQGPRFRVGNHVGVYRRSLGLQLRPLLSQPEYSECSAQDDVGYFGVVFQDVDTDQPTAGPTAWLVRIGTWGLGPWFRRYCPGCEQRPSSARASLETQRIRPRPPPQTQVSPSQLLSLGLRRAIETCLTQYVRLTSNFQLPERCFPAQTTEQHPWHLRQSRKTRHDFGKSTTSSTRAQPKTAPAHRSLRHRHRSARF